MQGSYISRRSFIGIVGMSALAVAGFGLAGCSGSNGGSAESGSAADQSKVHNRALNRKMNAEYLEKLKEKMDVVILTPEQKAAFQKACQPIYEQFGKDIGEDLIKEVQELSAAFKK